jgi:hypothetical protein
MISISSWCEWFLVAVLSFVVYLGLFGLFLDFIWNFKCQKAIKIVYHESLYSVFWIIFSYHNLI